LDAAKAAAHALLAGQQHSGGWHYRIEFGPEQRERFSYRRDLDGGRTPDPVSSGDRKGPQGWHIWRTRRYKGNLTLLDDDTTQAALRFLIRLDRLLDFQEERVHEAIRYGLASLLNAQYPNGAWSHNCDRFPGRPRDERHYPIQKASYPHTWPAKWPKVFAGCYAINDAITPRAIETMLLAWQTYDDERYRQSALRGGDFLLLAQMPQPQPAWAQQYDPDMHPVWDRAFEPPAISGSESQTVLETLIRLAETTGATRFLTPVPAALDYFRRSTLPDGRLARFYELRTNRPIYFTRDAEGRHVLTYEQEQLATHYAFIVESRLDAIEASFKRVRDGSAADTSRLAGAAEGNASPNLTNRVAAILSALDARGAWVEEGRLLHHGTVPASGIIDIRNNAPGFNNPVEIAEECGFQMPCLPFGNYVLNSQEEIDEFQFNYPGCTELEGEVLIYYGGDITNLDGLGVVTSISGSLSIFNNDLLSDLGGLNSLNHTGGDLYLCCNANMTSLAGLDNMDPESLGGLWIVNNPSLSECDVSYICDYLAAPAGNVYFFNNAPGCNSVEEVEEACESVDVDEQEALPITIRPNPSNNGFIIITLENQQNLQIICFNAFGQKVHQQEAYLAETLINVTNWTPGIYLAVMYEKGKPVGKSKFVVANW
jgi:hypothetical protein